VWTFRAQASLVLASEAVRRCCEWVTMWDAGCIVWVQVSLGTVLFHILAMVEYGTPSLMKLYSVPLWANMAW
jgi:hypothetical protein